MCELEAGLAASQNEICDPELYLKKHHILAYIEDAVTFLLERREEDPKTRPYELLAEYFESIKKGTHVLYRDYSFISLSPYSRASFIRLFWHSFVEVAERGNSMKVMEYLSLVRLLCHNFPEDLVKRVARVIFSYDAMENLVCFSDFLYTFQVLFYYEQFLERCELVFMDLINGQTPLNLLDGGSTVVVSIPNTTEHNGSRPETANSVRSALSPDIDGEVIAQNSSHPAEKLLDAELFLKAIATLCLRMNEKEPWERCPSVQVLAELVSDVTSLTFYDFVLSLSKSEKINCEIGVLPDRSSLLTAGKLAFPS